MKYGVFKWLDFEKYVPAKLKAEVLNAFDWMNKGRYEEGKEENKYIVINTDEPYAEEVIDILRKNGHWEEANEPS